MGHVINRNGIAVDLEKIKAVTKWHQPTNVSEILNFLGLAIYYRRFVEGFSRIATPLTKLTQKNARFEWSKQCEEAFQKLKKKLVSAPILTLSISGKEFAIYSDASI